jgi:hypothetical protein
LRWGRVDPAWDECWSEEAVSVERLLDDVRRLHYKSAECTIARVHECTTAGLQECKSARDEAGEAFALDG